MVLELFQLVYIVPTLSTISAATSDDKVGTLATIVFSESIMADLVSTRRQLNKKEFNVFYFVSKDMYTVHRRLAMNLSVDDVCDHQS